MRFGHIELFCADVSRARDFYADVLGFDVQLEQNHAGGPPQTIWLIKDGVTILLRRGQPHAAAEMHQAEANIVLYTDSLAESASALQERGLEFRGDDGPGCLTFTDPDGHWFQLVGPEGM